MNGTCELMLDVSSLEPEALQALEDLLDVKRCAYSLEELRCGEAEWLGQLLPPDYRCQCEGEHIDSSVMTDMLCFLGEASDIPGLRAFGRGTVEFPDGGGRTRYTFRLEDGELFRDIVDETDLSAQELPPMMN